MIDSKRKLCRIKTKRTKECEINYIKSVILRRFLNINCFVGQFHKKSGFFI